MTNEHKAPTARIRFENHRQNLSVAVKHDITQSRKQAPRKHKPDTQEATRQCRQTRVGSGGDSSVTTKARRIWRRLVNDKHGSNHAENESTWQTHNARKTSDKAACDPCLPNKKYSSQRNQRQASLGNESKFKRTTNDSVSAREILGTIVSQLCAHTNKFVCLSQLLPIVP